MYSGYPSQKAASWQPTAGMVAAAVACAAVASLVLVSVAPTQHYAATSTRPATLPMASTNSMRPIRRVNEPSMVSGAAQVANYDFEPQVQSSSSQVAVLAGSALLFLGAALTAGRQLFAKAPESMALYSSTAESAEESKGKMLAMVNSLAPADLTALSRGNSTPGIDEVALAMGAERASRADLSPKDVILDMQRGNGRFWMGLSERPEMNALQRRALIIAQAPKIAVLSCSDSRVPVEIIFDQGLGEIFVVRMAGNILDANAHGSLEFAVKYLGVKVVLVIGHEGCGAVKGAITMSNEDISKEPFDLQVVLQSIKGGLDVNELNLITDSRSRDREAITIHTSNQVKKLLQNQLMAAKVADGSLMVAGAFYEISSGIVDFFSLDKNGLVIDI